MPCGVGFRIIFGHYPLSFFNRPGSFQRLFAEAVPGGVKGFRRPNKSLQPMDQSFVELQIVFER